MHFFAKIVCIYEKKAVILHRFLEKERGHIEIAFYGAPTRFLGISRLLKAQSGQGNINGLPS